MLLEQLHVDLEDPDSGSPFSGLHCASFLGIAELVAALIDMECDGADEISFSGHTPLAWAAHNVHTEVMVEEVNPAAEHRSRMPLVMGSRKRCKYCDGKRLIPTNQAILPQPRSRMLLCSNAREW